MDSGMIIAALAAFTILSTLAVAIFHFGYFLKDPENVEAAKRVAQDRESATTRVASNQGRPSKPLRQRLDESDASIARRSSPWLDVHAARSERMV